MALEMKIKGLMIDPVSNMPIIVLKDASGESVLPIWVGIFEANAIAMQLEKIVSPRPMTHDLLRSVIETLRARVERVVITDLRENTFFALIHLLRGEEQLADRRPARATPWRWPCAPMRRSSSRTACSTKSSAGEADHESEETERLRRWLETVDPEELGKYEM